MLNKNIAVIIALGLALIAIFSHGLYVKPGDPPTTQTSSQISPSPSQNEEPKVTATYPDPLDQAILTPSQSFNITFNYPLENQGELKLKFDPKLDYKIELSADRKTAKISPTSSFQIGNTYTLTIGPDTKFDGKKTLGHDILYHLKTIDYQGV